MNTITGIIFDYGGTLDSRGVHWSEVIWQAYLHCYDNGWAAHRVSKEQFREAYVHGERALARERIVLPQDTFADLLVKKVQIQIDYMNARGWLAFNGVDRQVLAGAVARHCYASARTCIDEARPVLDTLGRRWPMVLVSNFYGNVDSVLRDFDIRQFFSGIIESAVVGVRKPNPTIFRLGVDVLEMPASQVLVVGDSLKKDIVPAETIGCQTLWLKGKGWTADEDSQTHPNVIMRIAQVAERLGVQVSDSE